MSRSWFLRLLLLIVVIPGAVLARDATTKVAKPHVVFLIAEDEYKTWETLPEFAKSELEPRGYTTAIVHSDPQDKHRFPGLVEALREADLLVLSVRRRTPPKEQLDAVRAHLAGGKPIVGIRTASHAFAARKPADVPPGAAQWPEFDPEVLGGHYAGHHGAGPKTAITLAPDAAKHPILRGVDVAKLVGNGSLYRTSPLGVGTAPLLIGAIPDKAPEPVAWTRLLPPRNTRVFYTSLGHVEDFQNPEFRKLLTQAVAWTLGGS